MVNTGAHRRCVSCNKVSSQDIETNSGDFTTEYFMIDPIRKDSFICKECREWHEELMADYEAKDDPYGWLDDGTLDLMDLELEKDLVANDNKP
jgi:hypothetical protein